VIIIRLERMTIVVLELHVPCKSTCQPGESHLAAFLTQTSNIQFYTKIMKLSFFSLLFFVVFSFQTQAQNFWEPVVVPDSVGVIGVCDNGLGYTFIGTNKGIYRSKEGTLTW